MKPQSAIAIFTSALCFLAVSFTLTPSPAAACPRTASNYLTYQRRRNPDRCEGIRRQASGASFRLVSFATKGLNDTFNNTLTLRIPDLGQTPTAILRSYQGKQYQLDRFTPRRRNNEYRFNLATDILNGAIISPQSLRAIAKLPGNQHIYLPVIVDRTSEEYEIVFHSPTRTLIPNLEIRRNGEVIHSDRRLNPRQGEIRFTWDAKNEPADRYQLRVEYEQRSPNQRPENGVYLALFHHDPAWLH
ncbi:MAG: hypothetical protein AAGA60_02010 [Cyanobacteria bacterium P01_E01_bin.42]